MTSNKPPTNTSPDLPSTHDPFITHNRSHVVTQTQEEDPLELLTRVIAVAEAEATKGRVHGVKGVPCRPPQGRRQREAPPPPNWEGEATDALKFLPQCSGF